MSVETLGAVPLQKLIELDSGQHHIREQADMDRRAQAEKNVTLRQQIERIDDKTRKHGEQLAGIMASVNTIKWLVGVLAGLIPVGLGAAWALGRIIR